jgi:hypothetical protein
MMKESIGVFSPRLNKLNGLVNQIFTRPFSLVVLKVVPNILKQNSIFCSIFVFFQHLLHLHFRIPDNNIEFILFLAINTVLRTI